MRWSAKFASTLELGSCTKASFHSIAGEAFFVISVMRASLSLRSALFTATNTSFGPPCRPAASVSSGATLFCRKLSDTAIVLFL